MSALPQYRLTIRMLEYAPGKRERYTLRVTIETIQEFSALPYDLVVEHSWSGSVHTFRIRGLAIRNMLPSSPRVASYVEDFSVEHDGSLTITVIRADSVFSVPILLHRGKVQLGASLIPTFIDVELSSS
ncbi:MAG: hypothetical protein RML15_01470 [Bacteroidota bacterium]|nr:hypothetical protein [Candidatus Kapabacteria bacterium]MCS7303124.1 hypothetical protein [Candidatus Kapabacteria bacterium]MCX7936264.1 hypothetical protein [Chlorobiota bacterium]MDW8074455.1 hypothetical protein [Bacteroidota bacterium]MDW8271069.1 hypothetical protein [Bacteroidota bacterium]